MGSPCFTMVSMVSAKIFLSLKPDHTSLSGKDKYEGFLLDLVTALADKLGFDFSLEMIGDGRYGRYDSDTGSWSGMIGEVMSGAADMAVVDMTITRAREEVVDFSMP